MYVKGQWIAAAPVGFTAKRSQFKRTGYVTYSVRAYRGAIIRTTADGKHERESCPHQHSKPASARKCAERAAKRRNRGAAA